MPTKAETLQRMAERGFPVPPLVFFTVADWSCRPEACLEAAAGMAAPFVAVRSSALHEDSMGQSLAGVFRSVLNVPCSDQKALRSAIADVCGQMPGPEDQVIVQAMVADVSMSGVLMTRALSDGSPYYAINYDDVSGRTDTVTGGHGASKTVYVYRSVRESDFDSQRLLAVVSLARRLEQSFDGVPLDVEFAIDAATTAYLLQVRPIAAASRWKADDTEATLSSRIDHVAGFVQQIMTRRCGLFGHKTILGNMPDWNPAEMIGTHPTPLAASLYRELITREAWRRAREMMGYRSLPPTDLMVMVAGSPYIDVRASFNSFLPSGIDGKVGEKLVDAWLSRLDEHPAFHDKVEFEIVPTVLAPDFEREFQDRYGDLLDASEHAEYKIRLADLTKRAFAAKSLELALLHVEKLRTLQENTLEAERAGAGDLRQFDLTLRITEAVEQCRCFGTQPFSIIARHAFIAEAWLQAAMRVGALSEQRLDLLKRSIETISGELTRNFAAALSGQLPKAEFLRVYGHLRPGTYDILSPSYRERDDLFAGSGEPLPPSPMFIFTAEEKSRVGSLLNSCGLSTGPEPFLRYIRRAVAGREYGKFIFSRHVDHILHLTKAWGKHLDLGPHDLSMLPINDILSQSFQPLPMVGRKYFEERILSCRREHQLGQAFKLAWLIRSPRDVYIVPQHRSQPNFTGSGAVEADVAVVTHEESPNLAGRIVCIESADPGYDWIFTRRIAGLITRYGGANSHMAIRCAEYGLPAAIGCGEQIFEVALAAKRLRLDCAAKTILPVGRLSV
jgi:hypothetical protein